MSNWEVIQTSDCAHNSSVSSIVDNLKLQDKSNHKTLKAISFLFIRMVVKLSAFNHLFKYILLHFAKHEKLVCTVCLIRCVTTRKGSWVIKNYCCASFQSWHGRVCISERDKPNPGIKTLIPFFVFFWKTLRKRAIWRIFKIS